jgi:hypothetical protein
MASAIHTYNDQACNKPGVNKNHHVQAYTGRNAPPELEGENLRYPPVRIDLDHKSTEVIRDTSRIHVGKLYTVDHNLRFGSIGKVKDEDFARLELLIKWALGLT